jgi:hypothetical protein
MDNQIKFEFYWKVACDCGNRDVVPEPELHDGKKWVCPACIYKMEEEERENFIQDLGVESKKDIDSHSNIEEMTADFIL